MAATAAPGRFRDHRHGGSQTVSRFCPYRISLAQHGEQKALGTRLRGCDDGVAREYNGR